MIQLATLTGPRRLARGGALALGAALPLAIFAAIAAAVGSSASTREPSDVKPILDIVFGVVLVAIGAQRLGSQPKEKTEKKEHHASVGRSFAIGFAAMATNVTTLALFVPAMKLIAAADVSSGSKAVAAAIVFAITLTVVLVPLALTALAPVTAGRLLDRLGGWMHEHQRGISVVLAFGFGLYLLVKGVLAL